MGSSHCTSPSRCFLLALKHKPSYNQQLQAFSRPSAKPSNAAERNKLNKKHTSPRLRNENTGRRRGSGAGPPCAPLLALPAGGQGGAPAACQPLCRPRRFPLDRGKARFCQEPTRHAQGTAPVCLSAVTGPLRLRKKRGALGAPAPSAGGNMLVTSAPGGTARQAPHLAGSPAWVPFSQRLLMSLGRDTGSPERSPCGVCSPQSAWSLRRVPELTVQESRAVYRGHHRSLTHRWQVEVLL